MRLSEAALRDYHGAAQLPAYNRANLTPGIVHLGVGNFHRAHQAVYIDDLLSQAPDWGIRAMSLRRPDTAQALGPQDGLYMLGVRGPQGLQARVIGSVLSVETGTEAAIAALACPTTKLVTITVTEKGYAAGGPLAQVLSEGLARRAATHGGGLSVLSCDNLADNGVRTGDLIRAAAPQALRGWIDDTIATPSSMVDRITPATSDADRAETDARTGLHDAWPVMTEPFRQWVIEDRFAEVRPPFEEAGAQMVADVAPFEKMKLRLLNGAHTTLAQLGPMLGHRYVADAVGDRDLTALISQTARTEVFDGLGIPRRELERYWLQLLERFANPALHHSLGQIASDSSEKVPLRLLPPWLEMEKNARAAPGLCLAVAAWLAAMRSARSPLADPRADALRALAELAPDRMIAALTAPDQPLVALRDRPTMCHALVGSVIRIERDGARAAIRAVLDPDKGRLDP